MLSHFHGGLVVDFGVGVTICKQLSFGCDNVGDLWSSVFIYLLRKYVAFHNKVLCSAFFQESAYPLPQPPHSISRYYRVVNRLPRYLKR